MKQGLTLEELGRKVKDQAERKDDLVVDTRNLTMLNGEALVVSDGSLGAPEYAIEQIAHRQIGERLGIPAKFYDGLRRATRKVEGREEPHEEVRRLLDRNVNTLLRERPERRLIRTFKPVEGGFGRPHEPVSEPGIARAFLSDRYRRRDNDELLERIVPILSALPGAEVASCAVTDTRLYLKVVTPRLEGEVKLNDPVQAGVVIRNSEVGHGSLSVMPMIFRLVCLNGMIVGEAGEAAKRYSHVGRRIEADEEGRYSDATLKLDDDAFYAKIGEDVKRAVDETAFNALLVQMRASTEGPRIEDPVEAVERLSKRFTLSETEGKSVIKHLAEGGDLSAYGMLNAVTRMAQDVDSYERATELETIGGQLLALAPTKEWEAIAA